MSGTRRRLHGDAGTGVFATAAGALAFVLFVVFAVQLLFGLHAASVVTAVANDAARRAAAADGPPPPTVEADAARNLGRMGDRARFTWTHEPDTVVLTVSVTPPRFVPASIGGLVGLDRIERTARARVERFQDAGPP